MSQGSAKALISSVLSIGDNMGIKTVAEGIETDEQYQALVQGGCVEGQGYLISHPIEAAAVVDMLSEQTIEK
jgi:EAL domain-containing protein (putative c-di-GMP-specific phosphodiesterase class I)